MRGETYHSKGVVVAPAAVSTAFLPGIYCVIYLDELVKNTKRQVQILVAKLFAQSVDDHVDTITIVVVSRDIAAIANEYCATF